jgi:DNA-binding transcriptional regulator LsrR (DeoR family)
MSDIHMDWPQMTATVEDLDDQHLRLLIKVAFALEGKRSADRVRRLLIKAGGPDAAEFKKMSGSRIAELRNEAEAIGLLSIGPRLNRDLLSPLLSRDMGSTLCRTPWQSLERYLKDKSEGAFKKLVVVHSNSEAVIDYGETPGCMPYRLGQLWNSTLSKFGLIVAPHVYAEIQSAKRVGLSWGQTCGSVVQGLKVYLATLANRKHADTLSIFPVAGKVEQGADHARLNATYLADRLRQCLCLNNPSLSLEAIPCAVPAKDLHQLNADTAYQAIFGNSPGEQTGLAWRADAIVTSVGARHNPRTAGQPWAVSMARGFVGDIGGAMIPENLANAPTPSSEQLVWTGLTREMLREVARRSPGVILVAAGENKKAITRQAIFDQAVTIAIIDQKMADELEREIPRQNPPV